MKNGFRSTSSCGHRSPCGHRSMWPWSPFWFVALQQIQIGFLVNIYTNGVSWTKGVLHRLSVMIWPLDLTMWPWMQKSLLSLTPQQMRISGCYLPEECIMSHNSFLWTPSSQMCWMNECDDCKDDKGFQIKYGEMSSEVATPSCSWFIWKREQDVAPW